MNSTNHNPPVPRWRIIGNNIEQVQLVRSENHGSISIGFFVDKLGNEHSQLLDFYFDSEAKARASLIEKLTFALKRVSDQIASLNGEKEAIETHLSFAKSMLELTLH